MKTLIVVLSAALLLTVGVMAYAHGPGAAGWGGAHMMGAYGESMMGQGYGGHMMGPYNGYMMGTGYTGHMMNGQGQLSGTDTKFLNDTVDLRKQLHEKKFDFFEANRNPKTDPAELTQLEKEITDLQTKIAEKAPRGNYAGYGRCW